MSCDSPSALPPPPIQPRPNRALVMWSWPPRPESIPQARGALTAAAVRWQVSPPLVDLLRLAVTELTSNVVRHAAAVTDAVRVVLAVGPVYVRLDVADGSSARPRRLSAVGQDCEYGRGLTLVRALVAEVDGTTDLLLRVPDGGKTLRIELPLR
jgi:anti-sigma regulatory factor (Ser/Thr protein kinase)